MTDEYKQSDDMNGYLIEGRTCLGVMNQRSDLKLLDVDKDRAMVSIGDIGVTLTKPELAEFLWMAAALIDGGMQFMPDERLAYPEDHGDDSGSKH